MITQLDLVITCDTAIGHLAGALGKPVWVLLPFVSHWIWMAQREDSPWYPNTRLFRQSRPGDWQEVIQRVLAQLALLAQVTLTGPVKAPGREFSGMPLLPVSWGEVFDKLTILEIKTQRISDAAKRAHIVRELSEVQTAIGDAARFPAQLQTLIEQLKEINDDLWDVEDALRLAERNKSFDSEFVALARQVYITNDQRAFLKRQINDLLGSDLVEEKSYAAY